MDEDLVIQDTTLIIFEIILGDAERAPQTILVGIGHLLENDNHEDVRVGIVW